MLWFILFAGWRWHFSGPSVFTKPVFKHGLLFNIDIFAKSSTAISPFLHNVAALVCVLKNEKKETQFLKSVPQTPNPSIKWHTWNFHKVHKNYGAILFHTPIMIKAPLPLLWHICTLKFRSCRILLPSQWDARETAAHLLPKWEKWKTLFSGTKYCVPTAITQLLKSSPLQVGELTLFSNYILILCSERCQMRSLASHKWARLPLERRLKTPRARVKWNLGRCISMGLWSNTAPYSWAGDSNLSESNQHGMRWYGNMHIAT